MQPARRVDHQQVRAVLLGLGHRVKGQRGGIAALGRGQDGHARAGAPDLQLFNSRRAKGITGGNHHGFACGAKLTGQFANGRGLARAIDAHDQNHLRAGRVKGHRFSDRFHDAGDFRGQQGFDFLDAETFAKAPFGHIGGHAQGRVDAHIGGDEQLFELLKHIVVERAAFDRRSLTAAHDPAKDTGFRRFGCLIEGTVAAPRIERGGVDRAQIDRRHRRQRFGNGRGFGGRFGCLCALIHNGLKPLFDLGRRFEQPILELFENCHVCLRLEIT